MDTDGDGMPDDWNAGYTAEDSTTDLTLDDDDDNDGIPDDEDDTPLGDEDDGNNTWLYIIIILVIVGIVVTVLMLKAKGSKPAAGEPQNQEFQEQAPEETMSAEELPVTGDIPPPPPEQ